VKRWEVEKRMVGKNGYSHLDQLLLLGHQNEDKN